MHGYLIQNITAERNMYFLFKKTEIYKVILYNF